MERPLQVGECIGCGICIRECPPNVMTLVTVDGRGAARGAPGPDRAPGRGRPGTWLPLSEVTREALKPEHDSPWGDLFTWKTRSRPKPWQVWTTMVRGRAAAARSRPARRPAPPAPTPAATSAWSAPAATTRPTPSPPRSTRSRPCAAGSARRRARPPAGAASWTSRSRSGRSSASPPSTASCRPSQPPAVQRTEKVAIVGGGPAGMSAAYYLARLGYPVTVLEAMPVPGGMMAIGIPEYRLPREVLQAGDRRGSSALGRRAPAGHGDGPRLHAWPTSSARASRRSSSRPARPRAGGWASPATSSRGVIPATRFLKEVNLGEHPHLSGDVIVVGGGSTAMDAARSARRSGAATVTIVYRRGRKDMPAQAEEIEAAEREGIIDPRRAWRRPRSWAATARSWRCAATSSGRRGAPGSPAAAHVVGADRRHPRAARHGDPRRDRRGARPVHPARGRRASRSAAGPASSPTRGPSPPAGPASSPAATSSPGPKTIIEAVAAGRRAAALHPRVPGRRQRTARPRSSPRSATRRRRSRR